MMNNVLKIYILLGIVFLIATSCEQEDNTQYTSKAVVEGYLYEASTVSNIKLTELLPFESLGSEEELSIQDAEIELEIAGEVYQLTEDNTNPGYYNLEDPEIVLKAGQQLDFSFQFSGETVSATTIVPSKPVNVKLSDTLKYIEQITSIRDLTGLSEITVEVTWSNSDNSYYYVTVKNIETDPETIDPNDYIPDVTGFDFPPLITDFSQINFATLNYYGTYQVVVYRVNNEFVDLYNSQSQDSRTMSEPLTNIINGYGIFTAFATDTVYLEIKP